MRADRPSFTAQRVAAQRARLDRPSSPDGNPDAEQRLYESLGNPLLFPRIDPGRMRRRTEWFDKATVEAVNDGVQQIVIVGAGYDGRTLRFSTDGVRWIEVDHPATQTDKRRRVEALGVPLDHVSFAAVDLVNDDLDAALDGAGHRAQDASLFICEGLLSYLPMATIISLLNVLRDRATPESRLAANFRVTAPPRWLGDHVAHAVFDGILKLIGEKRLTVLGEGDPERLLTETGWAIQRQDIADSTRLDGGSRGMLVVATPQTRDDRP